MGKLGRDFVISKYFCVPTREDPGTSFMIGQTRINQRDGWISKVERA